MTAERDGTPHPGEVYFEIRGIGEFVRVAAIDAATGVEVVVSGPASASTHHLERLALRKLERRLAEKPRPPAPRGRFA
jgi:hypothetical protein